LNRNDAVIEILNPSVIAIRRVEQRVKSHNSDLTLNDSVIDRREHHHRHTSQNQFLPDSQRTFREPDCPRLGSMASNDETPPAFTEASFQEKITALTDWAMDSTVAKRINFDGTVIAGIAQNTDFGKGDVSVGQRACIDKLYRVWNVAGWMRSRARKAAGLPPQKRRKR